MQVIQRILKMAAKGTKVYYITGNHDDALRRYTDFSSGNIHLRDKLILKLKNKTYWIFHGDIFDASIKYSPLLAKLGGKGYEYLILLNRLINKIRAFLSMPRMSFAKRVKNGVKEAIKYISDFEDTAIKLAVKQKYDYVICGHIHRPQMRTFGRNSEKVIYMNSGDWVENLTALEYQWGGWSVYEYDETDYKMVSARLQVKSNSDPDLTEEDSIEKLLPDTLFEKILQKETGSENI